MFNFKIKFLILLVAASVIASLMIHNHAIAALQSRAEISRHQLQQLLDFQAEQRRLSNSLVPITTPVPSSHSVEIAKLRAEAEALRKRTNELSESRNGHRATSTPSQSHASYTPEYWAKMRAIEGTRSAEASYITMAMLDYASDHQEQLPASLDQVASYLKNRNFSLDGTNFTMPAPDNFEIVFQGSTDQLNGIPWGSIALVREKQTWLSPDGTPTRVYGMVNGLGQTVSSGDNFQSWEAEHVIPAPKSP